MKHETVRVTGKGRPRKQKKNKKKEMRKGGREENAPRFVGSGSYVPSFIFSFSPFSFALILS